MSVITIPDKESYIARRVTLLNDHNLNKQSITDILDKKRSEINTHLKQSNDAKDDVTAVAQSLVVIKESVASFNTECDEIQKLITANNGHLTNLRDSIKTAISTANATAAAEKAAKDKKDAQDAQDAQAAKDAEAKAAEALEAIRTSVKTKTLALNQQLADIGYKNLDELSSGLDEMTISSDNAAADAISQSTRDLMNTLHDDEAAFLAENKSTFDAIKRRFEDEKKKVVDALNEKVKVLTGLLHESDIKQIGTGLNRLNYEINSSMEGIETEYAQLKTDFVSKRGEFNRRKGAIEAAIARDRLKFDEDTLKITDLAEKLDKLESIDQASINYKDQMYGNVKTTTIDTDNSPIQAVIISELNKAANPSNKKITVDAILLRINTDISIFNTNITHIEQLLGLINTEHPEIVDLKRRIDGLKAAKLGYEQQSEQQSEQLKQEIKTQLLATSPRSGSPSPSRSPSPRPRPSLAASAAKGADTDTEDEAEGADDRSTSLSLMDQKGRHGRKRPLFQGVPQPKKQRYIYVPSSPIPDFPIYLIDVDDAVAKSGGGKIIQHGGADLPANAVIYQLDPTYDDNIILLASLDTPEHVLNDDELIGKLKKNATRVDSSVYSSVYSKIQKGLISSDDETLLAIARRAVYKSSILKLMGILDLKVERKQGLKTYTDMYKDLWEFANPNDAVGVINRLAPKKTQESEFMFQPADISQIVGWTTRAPNNPNLDNYFKVFTNCGKKSSTFLDDVTKRKGKDGKLKSDKAVAYRFKLNWIILIAFYCLQTFPGITYANVGELIENTYETFLGWMTHDTYKGMFFKDRTPVLLQSIKTYSEGVNKKIKSDITGDTTFTPLKTEITKKLCDSNMKTDAKNHDDDPDDLDFIPEPDSDGESESGWKSESGDTSSRSSLSSAGLGIGPYKRRNLVSGANPPVSSLVPTRPSSSPQGKVLLDLSKLPPDAEELTRQQIPDISRVGPRTPSPPPEVALNLGRRPAINSDWMRDAIKYNKAPFGPVNTQLRPLTARADTAEKKTPTLSGSLSDRRPPSTRTDLVNPNNPSQKQHPTSNLPGKFPPPSQSGQFIRTAKPLTAAAATSSPVSTPVQPPKPHIQPPIGNSPLQRRTRRIIISTPKDGGNKRTRKHRSAPTPAPETRRRRRRGVIRPPPEKGHKYTRRRSRT